MWINVDKQMVPASWKSYREGKLVQRCELWYFLICHKPKGRLWNLTLSSINVFAIRHTENFQSKQNEQTDLFRCMLITLLDGGAISDRSTKIFPSSHHPQQIPGHPTHCSKRIASYFPRVRHQASGTDHTYTCTVDANNEELYTDWFIWIVLSPSRCVHVTNCIKLNLLYATHK